MSIDPPWLTTLAVLPVEATATEIGDRDRRKSAARPSTASVAAERGQRLAEPVGHHDVVVAGVARDRGAMVSVSVVAPEMLPPLESGSAFLRHW